MKLESFRKQYPLTQEQFEALVAWKKRMGRGWKQELSLAWFNGNYGYFEQEGYLQQLRNEYGGEWLVAFSITKEAIARDADYVAKSEEETVTREYTQQFTAEQWQAMTMVNGKTDTNNVIKYDANGDKWEWVNNPSSTLVTAKPIGKMDFTLSEYDKMEAAKQTLAKMERTAHFHALKVRYIGPTNFRGSRIKITSDRFESSVTIEYDSAKSSNTTDQAVNYLKGIGFRIIGTAEGNKREDYIFTSTFDKF